jgi:hypothetical protein
MLKKIGKYVKKKAVEEVQTAKNEQPNAKELDIAAISMALHLYFDDQHEVEQTGFWLNRPLNHQAAWAAKSILFKKSPVRKQ